MTRRDLVLAVLAAAGENATFTPVQVQKLFFIIDREAAHLVDGPHFAFEPYDYGPFDRAVYEEFELLAVNGLVQIDSSGKYRRYSLTAPGFAAGREILARLPEPTRRFLRETADWVGGLSFQQLVAAIYKRYGDMKVNSIFRQ